MKRIIFPREPIDWQNLFENVACHSYPVDLGLVEAAALSDSRVAWD